ncbi:molecular chaperone TorD family protein [Salinigranum halophilum]|jgi:DMSO reductase family type II enzyme chaperone|uniref:molecular chaperone TorD family protein n=1 Tax=Salinigranum halophilum TaxID=2565931 RepID=UPI0010A7BC26|nr:molecular chaperone TorD family protein [Salinigranum halophilum]
MNADETRGADLAELSNAITTDVGARGGVYALAAKTFDQPSEAFYQELATGRIDDFFAGLVDQSGLDVEPPDATVDEDRQTVAARFNDLFVVGYSEVVDKTDGTVDNYGPPVSLYESDYRPEVSWNDVNLDLARAYEYFGCQVNQETRRNHDHVRLQLEFMGYLCRREATVDPDVAAARLDFHDRHLRVVTEGIADMLGNEPGTGLYGRLADFLDRFTAADVEDLAARREDESP